MGDRGTGMFGTGLLGQGILRKAMFGRATTVVVAAVITTVTVGATTSAVATADTGSTYTVTASRDGGVTTELTGASFSPSPQGLLVVDRRGAVVDRIPTTVRVRGTDVALVSRVAADRTTATVYPQVTPQVVAAAGRGAHAVSARKDRAFDDMLFHIANGLNRAGTVSAAIGAGVGAVVGGAVGLVVGCAIIAGCLVVAVAGAAGGAAIGAGVGGVIGTQYGDPATARSIITWLNTR